MNNDSNFKDMGSFLIQIGLYLTTKEGNIFEKSEMHQNILDFLLQSYLYLNSFNLVSLQSTKSKTKETDTKEDAYLSKKQVIELYHPMLTNYASPRHLTRWISWLLQIFYTLSIVRPSPLCRLC